MRQAVTAQTTPTGTTRVAAVIGDPIGHSRSPAILNAAFAAAELDWVYVAFAVAPGESGSALDAMRTLRLGGLSVTMPHKAAVAAAVDRLDPAAEALGAVNCVYWRDGALVGTSTDGDGLIDTLRVDLGWDPAAKRCVVVGAGGAARAAVLALATAGAAQVTVVNRTASRAHEAAALAGPVGTVGAPEAVGDAELIVNATPVGMAVPGVDRAALAVDPTRLGAGQLVLDMVYDPLTTPLITAARAAGAHAVNGIGMLVHQAAHAFTHWTGQPAPVAAMSEAALAPPPTLSPPERTS